MRRLGWGAFLLAVLILTPLDAAVLAGDTVHLVYYFPDLSSPDTDYETVVVPGTFTTAAFKLHVNDATLIVDEFVSISHFTPATFNGWVLTDQTSSPINNVTIDASTNFPGFDASRLSSTGNTVTVNLQGLSWHADTRLQLDLNAAAPTPEPASFLLIIVGLAGIASRRSTLSPAPSAPTIPRPSKRPRL